MNDTCFTVVSPPQKFYQPNLSFLALPMASIGAFTATGRQWGQLKIEKSCHGIARKWVKCDMPTWVLCLLQHVHEQAEQPLRATGKLVDLTFRQDSK